MNELMGIINLSESSEKLKELTKFRTVGSVAIGGRYQVIDFVLSNMINSDIKNVTISTQGNARLLFHHLGAGKYWDLDRKRDGLFIFNPAVSSIDVVQKKGDIEIFKTMLNHIKKSPQKYVLLSRSYMICNADYTEMLKFHKKSDADITVMYKRINDDIRRFVDCDTVNFGKDNEIESIGKNLGKQKYYNISMEMYIMKTDLLIDIIEESIHLGNVNYMKEGLLNQVGKRKIIGYPFEGYLACVNSSNNYYNVNMDFLKREVQSEIFENDRLIYTKIKDFPPSFYGKDSFASNSIISSGCKIEGIVENSILARGVHIKKGAIVKNSILMQNTTIGETTKINHVILEKDIVIDEQKVFNGDKDYPYIISENI